MKLNGTPRIELLYKEDNLIIPFKKGQTAFVQDLIDSLGRVDLEKDYTVKIEPIRRKRSLDSNAYAWQLMAQLAYKLGVKKEIVYKTYIKEVGAFKMVCVQDKAVGSLRRNWESHGLGWATETIPSKLDGCTNVLLYAGSSTYDSKQMSKLIDLIVADCKDQGIETLTPNEIEELKQKWGG